MDLEILWVTMKNLGLKIALLNNLKCSELLMGGGRGFARANNQEGKNRGMHD